LEIHFFQDTTWLENNKTFWVSFIVKIPHLKFKGEEKLGGFLNLFVYTCDLEKYEHYNNNKFKFNYVLFCYKISYLTHFSIILKIILVNIFSEIHQISLFKILFLII
jgi:hypothetical protein